MEEKELLKLSVIEKGKVRKALVYYCNKYGIKCKSRKVFIDATMSLFEKGLADALNKLQKKNIVQCNLEPAHPPISLSHPIDVLPKSELHCPECQHYELPDKDFVFSSNKDRKRILKQLERCKKCHHIIQSSYIILQNKQEEREQKEILYKCGQKYTEA